MYKYYISELDIKQINTKKLDNKLKGSVENNRILLSKKGKYVLKNGEILFYIITDLDKEDFIVKDYLDKYTLFVTNENFKKVKFNEIDNDNIEINIKKLVYRIDSKSKTKLIIEIINNKIKDVYLISDLKYDNYSFKEDVSYLLSKII